MEHSELSLKSLACPACPHYAINYAKIMQKVGVLILIKSENALKIYWKFYSKKDQSFILF